MARRLTTNTVAQRLPCCSPRFPRNTVTGSSGSGPSWTSIQTQKAESTITATYGGMSLRAGCPMGLSGPDHRVE